MIDHISIEKWSKIDLQIYGGQYTWTACYRSDSTGSSACIDSMHGIAFNR